MPKVSLGYCNKQGYFKYPAAKKQEVRTLENTFLPSDFSMSTILIEIIKGSKTEAGRPSPGFIWLSNLDIPGLSIIREAAIIKAMCHRRFFLLNIAIR